MSLATKAGNLKLTIQDAINLHTAQITATLTDLLNQRDIPNAIVLQHSRRFAKMLDEDRAFLPIIVAMNESLSAAANMHQVYEPKRVKDEKNTNTSEKARTSGTMNRNKSLVLKRDTMEHVLINSRRAGRQSTEHTESLLNDDDNDEGDCQLDSDAEGGCYLNNAKFSVSWRTKPPASALGGDKVRNMKKRTADEVEQDGEEQRSLKHGNIQRSNENGNDEGPFEDDFEDEFESEDEIMEAGVDGRPDEEREAEEAGTMEVDRQTFIPGRHKLAPGEILAPDLSTYEMLHTLGAPISCLSFDFIRDHLGDGRARQKYPATVYAVAGTQAERGREKENQILVMKMSKLSKMERSPDEDSDNEDEDDEDENTDPVLESRSIRLNAGTNRIRVHQTPHTDASVPAQTLTATMTDTGQVLIHDITPHLTSFDTPGYITTPERSQPIHVIKSHRSTEGYAIDWSKTTAQRRLLTGDNDGRIFLTTQNNDATWSTDARPYIGHTGSVEELQWSPTEQNVFASGSSDGTVKIWDTRSKAHKPYISVQVSESDVNVLSWSRLQTHLLATGAEDGTWAVWDLRQWKPTSGATAAEGTKPTPVASFNFHKEQVISVEWHPTDDSIVAVAAGDNTMTLWDLAVELDDEESKYTADAKDVPPQLLFVHYMDSVKECHWHPQIAGVIMGTGHNFDVFKTINV